MSASGAGASHWADWFEGKKFTTDWLSASLVTWAAVLSKFRDRDIEVLEVGSFEGRSANFLAKYLPRSRLTCIDNFDGPYEQAFDLNVAEFGDRLAKIKGRALSELERLTLESRIFDVIYLDAGKDRDQILGQSLLAWSLLGEGGVLIWDDYRWGPDLPLEMIPRQAVDVALALYAGKYDLLYRGNQVIICRRAGSQMPPRIVRWSLGALAAIRAFGLPSLQRWLSFGVSMLRSRAKSVD